MLHYSSVLSTNTQKNKAWLASVFIQMCIEKIFCFYFLVINVYKGKTTDAFHPWRVEKRLMFTFTSANDFFSFFLAVDFIRNI